MWKNIALIPVALLLAFIGFEALARLWVTLPGAYPLQPGILVLDRRVFWMPEPGYRGKMDNRVDFRDKTLTVTPVGARLTPCAEGLDGSAQRIFLLGDSQTFGFGLGDDETWANRLQCALAGTHANPPRIYNLGVHATNIDQYVKRGLHQVSRALRKGDLVVVGVTWNDLISHISKTWIRGARDDAAQLADRVGALVAEPSDPLRRAGVETWRYRFYRWSGFLVPSVSSFKAFVESLTYSSAMANIAVPRLRLLYYRFRSEDAFVRKLDPDAVADNMEMLSILNDAVAAKGARMIVYLLSNRLFFDDTYYQAYSKGGKSFPVQEYMGYLTAPYCERLAMSCVSAFDALRTPGPDTYTFPFDGHYNEAGAKAVARRLGDYLARECVADGHPCLLGER